MMLDTDASSIGVDAVLSQHDPEGKERVLGYASRALNCLEGNYCVTRRELLSMIFGVEAFPVPNMAAETMAQVVVREIICQFGTPCKLHSDQGR